MEPTIVLGRIGHYFTAGSGTCSTAIVVETFGQAGEDGSPATGVNVAGWNHDGSPFSRTSVPVYAEKTEASVSSFHLNRDCPWSR